MWRSVLVGCIGLAALASPMAAQPSCPTQTTAGHFAVTFIGASYNAGTNVTTFEYSVENLGGQALSHWVLGYSDVCAVDLLSCTPAPCFFQIVDPTTGVTGVKFDNLTVESGQTEVYSFTLQGDGTGSLETVVFALKYGSTVSYGEICGPSCPVPVELMQFSVESSSAEEAETEGGEESEEGGGES